VIHRDLKPGNILFDPAGEPYISDFGIAKISQGQSTTVTGGAIIGTPAYMSPEQAQGDPLDGRSDVYAMGVILYEMLAGAQPYQATTPMAVVVKHITDPIPHILDANPRLPAGIEAIIEKAMAKNPDDRFSTAGELAAALDALMHGQSAEEALKTATLAVTRSQAAKTRQAGKLEDARDKNKLAKQGGVSSLWFAVPVVLVVLVGVALVAAYFFFKPTGLTGEPLTSTPGQILVPPVSQTPEITKTPELSAPTVTATPIAQPTDTATPAKSLLPMIGGADMVAFIANNEVWLMNIDGTGLKQLTHNQSVKSELQWMPDGKTLLFISGKDIDTVDSATGNFDTLLTFSSALFLDDFRISPDSKQVAISFNRQIFIVPYDLDALKKVHKQDDLAKLKGCIKYTGHTEAAVAARSFRWSFDGKLISWLFAGVSPGGGPADLVHVVDISACDANKIKVLDEFPGTRFSPRGYGSNPTIPDFDWDGRSLFLMNSAERNNGWGDLYVYNEDVHQADMEVNPVGGKCCYRDARWSPDGKFIFVAFQDVSQVSPVTQFYFVPFGSLGTGAAAPPPIPLPEGFFKNPREAPQPALHFPQP
jgi:hypothetical protein